MSSERISRDHFDVRAEPVVFADWPINFAGAALHIRNDNANDVVFSIQDSNDGVTWNIVLFSDSATAGLISTTIDTLSFAALLFVSCRKYIRFTVAAGQKGTDVNSGVYVDLTQFPSKTRECPDVS